MEIERRQLIEALLDTIDHWSRMIIWAMREADLFRYETVDINVMYNEIGEAWGAWHCPLCRLYESKCEECILKWGYIIQSDRPIKEWKAVARSRTWPEWIYNATTKMMPALYAALRRAICI